MFTVAERDRVRARLLELAVADTAVIGAAITGSHAVGGGDRWSDVDLAFGVRGPLDAAMEWWTRCLEREFGLLHHWDLLAGSSTYRVFLLPGGLEVDIGFSPAEEFGARGPQWRAVHGPSAAPKAVEPVNTNALTGRAWHHVLHARVCIERRRWWQAEYWISAARDQVVALACLSSGHTADHAKGAHLLPDEMAKDLAVGLVRSLDEPELRRALRGVTEMLVAQLECTDAGLAGRLRPVLAEFGALVPPGRVE